jgi:hypothetical protein
MKEKKLKLVFDGSGEMLARLADVVQVQFVDGMITLTFFQNILPVVDEAAEASSSEIVAKATSVARITMRGDTAGVLRDILQKVLPQDKQP